MLAVVNEAALAYRDVIPIDRWHDPYVPKDELVREISTGIVFWVAEEQGRLIGVMGIVGLAIVARRLDKLLLK